MLMLENVFRACIQSLIDYASALWDSASPSTLKPLASIHKRAFKLALLKFTAMTAHEYNVLDVLPLTLKEDFNKGIIMHKIVTGDAPSTLKFNFHSNQNRHSHKLIVHRPRLYLFKCSLMFSGGNLWNSLPLRIKILTDHKAFRKEFKQYLMEKTKNHNKN